MIRVLSYKGGHLWLFPGSKPIYFGSESLEDDLMSIEDGEEVLKYLSVVALGDDNAAGRRKGTTNRRSVASLPQRFLNLVLERLHA